MTISLKSWGGMVDMDYDLFMSLEVGDIVVYRHDHIEDLRNVVASFSGSSGGYCRFNLITPNSWGNQATSGSSCFEPFILRDGRIIQ